MPARRLLPALVTLASLLAGCGATSPVRQVACLPGAEATLMMDDLIAGAGPSKLKSSTEAPRRTAITYTIAGRDRKGDLYQSGTPSAAVVLVPGASTEGKEDARLISLAEALARMRFTVLVPDIPNIRELRVKPEDARVVADGFLHLASRPDLAPRGRIGLGGVSYALGPAVLAALEPEVRDQARFLIGVGGYFSIRKTITYFTTGKFRERDGDPWQYLKPQWYGKWVFVYSNVERFTDPEDKATLTEMANLKVKDAEADVSALAAKLESGEAKALYALLTNEDPERVESLLRALPADVQADLDKLDVSKRDLSQLKARVLLFHGYDDNLVPYTESIAFANAAPSGRAWLINGFVHVDFAKTGFMDGWRMGCAVEELLAERWR